MNWSKTFQRGKGLQSFQIEQGKNSNWRFVIFCASQDEMNISAHDFFYDPMKRQNFPDTF